MNSTQLAYLLAGVTNLAIGLGFVYLWWHLLPRRYVILLAAARLFAVPEYALRLSQVGSGASAAGGLPDVLIAALGAVTVVCGIGGLLELVHRRAAPAPLLGVGVLLVAWDLLGSRVTGSFFWQQLPAPAVLGGGYIWIGLLLWRGPRLPGRHPLGALLAFAGLHLLDYPILGAKPWGPPVGLALAQFNSIAISAFLFITLLDEAQRLAEKSDAALRESEQLLRAVVSGAPLMLFALDRDGVVTLSEGKGLAAIGRRSGETVGKSMFELLRDAPTFAAPFRRALNGETVYEVGTFHGRTMEGWITPMRDGAGNITGAIGVAADITERARVEEALRKSEEKFAVAFRSGPNPIILARLEDGLLVDANRAYYAATGFTREEVIGRSAREVLWPNPAGREAMVKELRAHGRAYNMELQMRTKDGPPLDVLVSIEAVDLDGVPHTLGVAVDITERRRVAQALTKSEEKFAKAFHASPNPITITRVADGVIVDVNAAFLATYGFARDEVVGRTTLDLIWPDAEQRAALIARIKAEGRVRGIHQRFLTKSRQPIDILLSIETIELDGQPHLFSEGLDITERNRAEAALRESEERYRNLVESSPDAISVIQDDRIQYINRAAVGMIGAQTRPDVIGRPLADFLTEQSRPVAAQRIAGILQGKRDTLGELTLRKLDGSTLEVEALGIRLQFAGRPAVVVIHRDITERIRAEIQLRESEERFRLLVHDLGVGVALLDASGRVLLANRAACDFFGLTEEEVKVEGYWQRELVGLREDGTPLAEAERTVPRAIRDGTATHDAVLAFRNRRSGRMIWAIVNVDPQLDAEGRVRNVIMTLSDITQRRETEAEQQRLREAVMASAVDWTLTFDAVPSPLLILDAGGRVRRLNRAAREVAGLDSYGDAVGRTIAEMGEGEPWRSLAALTERVRRERVPASVQVREDRSRRAWYLTANAFTVSGEGDRIIVIARDVTDLEALQESLRRTETMSALGSLVAGVAHEVRNPLFAVSATVDAFEARFGSQEGYARYTQTLRQEVNRLSELMQELLEYGKPPRLDLADSPVEPVIRRAVAACETLAGAAGVTVELAPAPETAPSACIDVSRMQQVFQNLIENAIQHSPRGGTVTVQAAAGEPGMVQVTVADRGPGFREDDLPHIFEPFFTRRRGGTGLGLSIVQRIVEQHGGDISAENRPGGGALITVRLAAADPPDRSTLPKAAGAEA
jgi:PAS domain S-box-containing protein